MARAELIAEMPKAKPGGDMRTGHRVARKPDASSSPARCLARIRTDHFGPHAATMITCETTHAGSILEAQDVVEERPMMGQNYRGYLAPHVDRICAMHLAGAGTRTIAEALYQIGVRAETNDPNIPRHKMRHVHHVVNLRLMTLHVLQRLGLRTRRKRPPRWPRT
jgi:hypothetical protein